MQGLNFYILALRRYAHLSSHSFQALINSKIMFSPSQAWQILQLQMKLSPALAFIVHIKFTLTASRNPFT